MGTRFGDFTGQTAIFLRGEVLQGGTTNPGTLEIVIPFDPFLEAQGNVVQCLALSHLRLGTLLSYLIKNLTGAEAKPERRKIPEVRNPG